MKGAPPNTRKLIQGIRDYSGEYAPYDALRNPTSKQLNRKALDLDNEQLPAIRSLQKEQLEAYLNSKK